MLWGLALLKVQTSISYSPISETDESGQRLTGLCGSGCRYGQFNLSFIEIRHLFVYQADCVFPTRTARFGVALTFNGPLNLRGFIGHFFHPAQTDLRPRS